VILRDYQERHVERASRHLFETGRALVHQATGTGKTPVLARIAADVVSVGGRVLVVVHRTELALQAASTLEHFGLRAEREQGRFRASPEAEVVVASVQTMRGKRKERWDRDWFDLIVVDECHHGAAKSYTAIFDYFEHAMRLGVTATPWRGDGQSLAMIFGGLSCSYDLRTAIADGWLVPLKPQRITISEVDLDGISIRAGDFVAGQLDEAYGEDGALHAVARPLLELAGDRPTLVFAAGVESGTHLATVINNYKPGAAVALSGKSPAEQRELELSRFRRGERQMIVNVGLFTEGTDLPECSCVAIARPTRSKSLYSQMVGRATRLAAGAANIEESIRLGKADAIVLDFAGVTTRHRLASAVSLLADDDADPDVVAAAEELLETEELDVSAALERAAELVVERAEREAREAKVRYFAQAVDPFLGAVNPVVRERWAGDPATDGQVRRLVDDGFKPPGDLTKGEASAIIGRLKERKRLGLCTAKQARYLHDRGGVDARDMPKVVADRIFKLVADANWRVTRSELYALAQYVIAGEGNKQGGDHGVVERAAG
jgi:superfamily II DNA or RNA helicase